MSDCLAEDQLLALSDRGLGDHPAIEAHLADCAECSALVAALFEAPDTGEWGAMVGRSLGPYRLEAQIGAGGMGAVYRGVDERLGRAVAIKVVAPRLAGSPGAARLEPEARAAAAIAHPNVVRIYDVGRDGEVDYIVSELVDGETLRSVLERGRPGRERALELAGDLLGGLAAAHAGGVAHRDLKPENLIVDRAGALRILDFGLARLAGDDALGDTIPGAAVGTPGYMAPEQARGERGDRASDLFAAGAILFELLAGRRAFPGDTHAERITATLRDDPVAGARDELGELAPLIERCLARDPRERFESAADLAWALERDAARAPVTPPAGPAPASRRAFLGGAAAAIASAGVALLIDRRLRRGAAVAPRFQFRQLTYRKGRLMNARFIDGGAGWIYAAAWEGAPLAVFAARQSTATPRQLELPPADVLAVSAAGEVALALGKRHVENQAMAGQLAVVPLDGSAPRPLTGDVQDADYAGGELAIVRRGGYSFAVEWPPGEPIFEAGWITHLRASPDGRRLACMVHPDPRDDRGEVVLLDRSGRSEVVSAGWATAAGLAWAPGGDRLLFTAARDSARSALWSVGLGGGAEQLELEAPGRLRLHDVRADGAALISRDAWRLRTFVGGDGEPDRDVSLTDFCMAAALSDDGRVLFTAELGGIPADGVYVRTAGEQAVRIGPGFPLAASPAADRVVAALPGGALVVYSTDSDRTVEVALPGLTRLDWARWPRDNELVIGGGEPGRPPRIWRVPIGGGAPAPITAEGVSAIEVALDEPRSRLALIDREHRLLIVELASGRTRPVDARVGDRVVCGWRDGAILARTPAAPIEVVRIDPATGSIAPHRVIDPPPVGLRGVDAVLFAGPASSRHAYSFGEELSQLYLLERS